MNPESSLVQLIKDSLISKEGKNDVDPTQLRYALYVRKSTEDEGRQVQSIDDQIRECVESIINQKGIKFDIRTDLFREEKSAKEAGTRPAFTKMIEAVKDGKYQGIIAWHYDRLARNMKEAGEIIDMIDRGIIKDLRLARATFENTPNGKMILGINFVLSKHYSDHLSESVLRGNKSSLLKGRVLRHVVHGYRLTKDRNLIADGDNYSYIERAFRMRLDEDKSLKDVAKYLKEVGYKSYRLQKGHQYHDFTVDGLSKLMKNPIYAGVYQYGDDAIEMSEVDPDFSPMITADEYIKLNGKDALLAYSIRNRAKRSGDNDVSDFLRKFVICFHCSKTMHTTVVIKYGKAVNESGEKKQTRHFRFYCGNDKCEMYKSGPAGNVIRDYAVEFLKNYRFSTEATYRQYLLDAGEDIAQKKSDLTSARKYLEVQLTQKKQQYENIRNIISEGNEALASHYTAEDLDTLKQSVDSLSRQHEEIKQQYAELKGGLAEREDLLKLYENAGELLRLTYGMSLADEIIRIFFSNFVVEARPNGPKGKQKQWSIKSHCLAEPFDKFVENGEFLVWSGRQDSNLRPLGPKPSALPDCATPRRRSSFYQIRA